MVYRTFDIDHHNHTLISIRSYLVIDTVQLWMFEKVQKLSMSIGLARVILGLICKIANSPMLKHYLAI